LTGHGPQSKFLPESIKMPFAGIREDFSYYGSVQNLQKNIFILPAYLEIFIPTPFKASHCESKIKPNIDDRMFVCTWIGNNELSEKPKTQNWQQNDEAFYKNWYQLIFVDGKEPGCGSTTMIKDLVNAHTLIRWEKSGTLYGISRYSFILLSDAGYGRAALFPILKNIYSKLCVSALAQRSAILAFSERATSLSEEISSDNLYSAENKKIIKKAVELHKDYMKFLKQLYFREITAQEQGIELYDMLRDKMRIEEMANDLRDEINELHQFVSTLENERQSEAGHNLTWLATLFLPVSVLLGFFGMSTLPENGLDNLFAGTFDVSFWYSIIIIILLSVISIGILRFVFKRKK
jgi:hypothetical protein